MIKKLIFSLFCTSLLTACHPVETNNHYVKNGKWGISESKPIHMSFSRDGDRTFHFILRHVSNLEKYQLIVRWNNPSQKNLLFKGMSTRLRFLVNDTDLIRLKPATKPRIVGYNLDNDNHVEEAVFFLTYEQLHALAYAKSVEVELEGKQGSVMGSFNSRHTYRGFKDFLNCSC